MKLSRRRALHLSAGAAVLAAIPASLLSAAAADATPADERLQQFTGGRTPLRDKITLTAPEIAENGNTVPVSIHVDSPMNRHSYVEAVTLLAPGNPNPGVITFHFTPNSGSADATTRIRLAKTQTLIAVARLNDGTVFMDEKNVKVTIGGCGG